jgi:hypothetical protein
MSTSKDPHQLAWALTPDLSLIGRIKQNAMRFFAKKFFV